MPPSVGGRKIGCQGKGADGWTMVDAVTQRQGKMPEPRRLDLPLLPTGQGERYYLERFMGAFGEEWGGQVWRAGVHGLLGRCLWLSRCRCGLPDELGSGDQR